MTDLVGYITCKVSYDSWKAAFDSEASRRATMLDESRTIVSKVDDKHALVMFFAVDMDKFSAMLGNPDFRKFLDIHEVESKIWVAQALPPPPA